jgi:tetratricopeptide (TPR) repeat protein
MEARGFVHRRLGNFDEVHRIFEEAIQVNPADYELWRNLGGLSYRIAGRYEDAIRTMRRAFELAPDQIGLRATIGYYYVDGEGQLDTLRAVIPELPDEMQPGASINLAIFERDFERALELISELQGPETTALPMAMAHALQRLGENERAGAIFEARFTESEAVPMADRGAGWWNDRGRILAGLGRAGEVVEIASTVAALYPGDEYSTLVVRLDALFLVANAGLADEACTMIEDMLGRPSLLTVHRLRLDWDFDPIRQAPCFQAALERYG